MGKRFMDTAMWDKQWFQSLKPPEKCAWYYLLSRCDAVGVWDVNLPAAEFFVNAKIDWEALLANSNGNIEKLSESKWWVVDFCCFQYGRIAEVSNSRVQNHLSSLLTKHGLWAKYLSTLSATVAPTVGTTVQDKDKEKDKDKDYYAEGVNMTKGEHSALVALYGERVVKIAIDKVAAQQIKTGKEYKSPRGAVLQWGIRAALEEIKKGGAPAAAGPACPECHVGGGNHGAFCSRKPA